MKKGTISTVRDYYLGRDGEDIFLDALRKFYDRSDLDKGGQLKTTPQEECLFTEWIFFDYKLKNGKTMLEDFYDTNPFKLPVKELSIYKDLQENIYGLYEIKNIETCKGMTLKNIYTNKTYYVQEFSGTFNVDKGDILTGRVGKIIDHYELVGSDPLILPLKFGKGFLKFFRQTKDHLTPKAIRTLLQ